MDLAPLVYLVLTAVFFIALMRMRVIVLKRPNGPRAHRTTYRQVKL